MMSLEKFCSFTPCASRRASACGFLWSYIAVIWMCASREAAPRNAAWYSLGSLSHSALFT